MSIGQRSAKPLLSNTLAEAATLTTLKSKTNYAWVENIPTL